jgi:hypothetical protein
LFELLLKLEVRFSPTPFKMYVIINFPPYGIFELKAIANFSTEGDRFLNEIFQDDIFPLTK